jgi:hypothetical protein
MAAMVAPGVPMALMLLAAQASAPASDAAPATRPIESHDGYGPRYDPPTAEPKPKPVAAPAPDPICQSREQQGQIVICAPRPQGYRLNPDIMEAKREKRSGGRPPRSGPIAMKDNSCQVVGPAGCFNAGINMLAAAATAAEMAKRLAEGKEIGSMFVTDPSPDEYQLYLMAKARREAREAEATTAAKVKAAAAAKPKQGEAAKSPEAETRPAEPSRE